MRYIGGLLLLLSATAMAAEAPTLLAVLGSDTKPYHEALAGLEEALRAKVPSLVQPQGEPKIPSSVRVVVVFGSKAARHRYPEDVSLIYAMAPPTGDPASALHIGMDPSPMALLANLIRIQPGLKRLGILSISPAYGEYLDRLQEAAAPLGITVERRAAKTPAEIPDRLRSLYGKADAVWLPSDPLLFSARTLQCFREFSRSNKMPLYVPAAGLVEDGGTASIGVSFRELGRTAGAAAIEARNGFPRKGSLLSEKVEVVISRSGAAEAGLQVPESVMRSADKILP